MTGVAENLLVRPVYFPEVFESFSIVGLAFTEPYDILPQRLGLISWLYRGGTESLRNVRIFSYEPWELSATTSHGIRGRKFFSSPFSGPPH